MRLVIRVLNFELLDIIIADGNGVEEIESTVEEETPNFGFGSPYPASTERLPEHFYPNVEYEDD